MKPVPKPVAASPMHSINLAFSIELQYLKVIRAVGCGSIEFIANSHK